MGSMNVSECFPDPQGSKQSKGCWRESVLSREDMFCEYFDEATRLLAGEERERKVLDPITTQLDARSRKSIFRA